MTLLFACFAITWVAILGLAFAIVALARQVGVLHHRLAPFGARTLAQRIRVGEMVPGEPLLRDIDGKPVAVRSIDGDARNLLIVFVAPECPLCKSLTPVLKSFARDERGGLRLIAVSDGDDLEAHRRFRLSTGLTGVPYVVNGEFGRLLGVSRLPYAVLIGAQGILLTGGLVNSREQLESLVNAAERGVSSVQEWVRRNAATVTLQDQQ
jgi:methylamine dehydrogenase accessory protein MauD